MSCLQVSCSMFVGDVETKSLFHNGSEILCIVGKPGREHITLVYLCTVFVYMYSVTCEVENSYI